MFNREKIAESKQDVPHDAKLLYTSTLQTNRNISQIQNTISRLISTDFGNFKRTSVKQCSVALNDNIVKDWYVLRNMENTVDIRDKSNISHLIFHNPSKVTSNCSKSIELAPNDTRENRDLIKDCFIKLDRLKTRKFVKENNTMFNKKEQNIVSSTPIGPRVKPSTCSVIFSPIDSNNIGDKSHWSKKCSLVTAKEDISNIERRDCYSSIHEAQIQVLLSRKSRVSTDSAVKNKIMTCEGDIHMAFTQKFETRIPHSLNMSTASSASQSRSLFGDTTYNHSTKGTDDDNIEKNDFSDKFIKIDLVDSSADLLSKQKQLLNSNAQVDTREIPEESLKSKFPENYGMERNIVEAIHEKIKNETVNISKRSLFSESRDNVNNVDARVLLTRLQDPFRIGRRTRYPKWHLSVSNVSNNEATRLNNEILRSIATDKDLSIVRYNSEHSKNAINLSFDHFESFNGTTRLHNDINIQIEKSVFLKPGKSWARSLSILNNINDGADLDKLSVGKGKKWRHSVRNILNMQKQGNFLYYRYL